MRFFLFLFFISFSVHAQDNDTLFSRIISVQNDTERVNQLYKRGFSLRNQNPQWAFEYGKRAETEALKTKSKKHIAKSYNLLGIMFYKRGNYRTAMRYHKQALHLREKINDVLGIAQSQTNLGNVYSDIEMLYEAEEAYLNAIKAYKQSGNNEKITDCLLNIGVLKHKQKQYDAAIGSYKMATEILPMNDYYSKAIFLTNIGAAYVGKGMIDMVKGTIDKEMIEKGIAYNQDALKLRLMADNYLETGDNYLNIGEAHLPLGNFDKAKYYIDTALYIANKNNYFELRYQAYKGLALYHNETKNFKEAFVWLKKYYDLGDSIIAMQAEDKRQFDFDEEAEHYQYQKHQALHNVWLLVSVFALVIFIPFYFIRFKR